MIIDTFIHCYQTPLGTMKITSDSTHILSIKFVENTNNTQNQTNQVIEQCKQELAEYFAGKRKTFSVPYKLNGTEFQKKAWSSLATIPFGETKSYQAQAESINNPKAVRAVGHANGQNKLLIIIPCHRVVGKDGNLVGFGAEIWRKQWLLEHEQNNLS